ncbi:MAG: cache domain-containing protein, partial [Treponema sp.]|nr:cache domain-containing protein [Treponema sp.]
MYPILKKLWKLVFSIQVLAVLLAFGLMVFLSNYYMSNIEREHLLKDVKNSITTTQAYIEGDLIEMETTLTVLTENVRDIIIQYNSRERTDTYLKSITQYMMVTDDRLRDYVGGIYGIFQVFDDVWISGVGRIPPDDYIVKERPWYDVAIKANGKVGITQPYIDFYSGEVSITFTRCIIDDDGTLLAIVCLDVNLERIRRHAVNAYVSEGSYGILMDNNFNILAHPHPLYVGRHITQMNDGWIIQNELLMGIEISERKAKDYSDKEAVLFVRQLNNGWYLAIVLYADKYYQSVREIAYILIILG